MSFANQALGAAYIRQNHNSLEKQVYTMPKELDREVARLKLGSMGIDHRRADRGAGEVPGIVAGGHLTLRPARRRRARARRCRALLALAVCVVALG